VPVNKIPLGPPLAKGEAEWFVSEIVPLMPPFRKGGLGGFCCACLFPKITAAYLLKEQAKLSHSSNTGMGFETTKIGYTKKKTHLYEVGPS